MTDKNLRPLLVVEDNPGLQKQLKWSFEGYEVFLAAGGEGGPLPRGRRATRPATVEELENTYAALERGLDRIDFFKARTPEAILRTLRTVISRAEPDLQEAGILRAIGFEIGAYLDRAEELREETERSEKGKTP